MVGDATGFEVAGRCRPRGTLRNLVATGDIADGISVETESSTGDDSRGGSRGARHDAGSEDGAAGTAEENVKV